MITPLTPRRAILDELSPAKPIRLIGVCLSGLTGERQLNLFELHRAADADRAMDAIAKKHRARLVVRGGSWNDHHPVRSGSGHHTTTLSEAIGDGGVPEDSAAEADNVIVVPRLNGRLLMVMNKGRGGWEFPGGKVGRGESPEVAARREVAEEAGATLGELAGVHLSSVRETSYRVVWCSPPMSQPR